MSAGVRSLEQCPALVLNADYRPLSYFPLSVMPWYESVKNVFLDRVNIVSVYDRVVRSPSQEITLPSVVSLKAYIRPARQPAFTRFNVYLRDNFQCQYCGYRGSIRDLTFDHVVPRSRGGQARWDNVVTACAPCNHKKGGHLPSESGMYPTHPPTEPSVMRLHRNGRRLPQNFLHESWYDYLYWDSELEP